MSCCNDSFRLPAPSECSMRSKARIDALFEDSRSVCSSSWCPAAPEGDGWCGVAVNEEDHQQRRVNSAVQARIEAMFASVEAESSTGGETSGYAAAVLPVKYMGAAPVGGRVASVRGLQEPLRQLAERIGDSVTAELEVSRRGLTYRAGELNERNNPFRRIAVWSALKLQTRSRPDSNNADDVLHAFVPLVADDRVQDTSLTTTTTTTTTNTNEDRHADLYRTMRGLSKDVDDYPPIFAVVMRRPGAARLLECHAFACRCEEDAIAAAATLYRALLADLDANARRPRQRNGLGCMSVTSAACSVVSGTLDTSSVRGRRRYGDDDEVSKSKMLQDRMTMVQQRQRESLPSLPAIAPLEVMTIDEQPVRPPRSAKNSVCSSANTEDEQSSSCTTNVSVVEDEAQHRANKAKDSDVGDASSASVANNHAARRNESNCSSSDSSPRVEVRNKYSTPQTNEERRMNAKNKINAAAATRPTHELLPSNQAEKIYEARRAPRHGEKSSSDRERSGSAFRDFDYCTENSIYETNRARSKSRDKAVQSRADHQIIYESSSQPIAARNATVSSRKSTSGSLSSRSSRPTARPPAPPPCPPSQESSYAGEVRRATKHRDHFRDVDKIYSVGDESAYGRARAASRSRERLYDVTTGGRQPIKSNDSDTSATSKRRLSRVSTMDRPLRRPSISNPIPIVHNHQQQQQQVAHHQRPHPPQRRRSRAGSEPPCTRTEAAVANAALMKRSQSDLDIDRGDLMTRVELPRRSSFLKPGSVRKRDGLEGGSGGTPLGFSELFDEFRNQEGLTSVDDILAAIIDPEGMSFNDLKPLYKEFLLKLAATLTQDELYQRSASIMRRRRRRAVPPQRRRSSRNLLRRAIKRSVSRLKNGGGSNSSPPTEFTSVMVPARKLNGSSNNNERNSSYGSSSSCDVAVRGINQAMMMQQSAHCHTGGGKSNRVLASKLGRRRSMTRCSPKSRLGHTTSEDSDTCRRISRSMLAANRSSSGYVSCSECSYDSESCTCVSADKCYCSLPRKELANQQTNSQVPPAVPATLCACDTDSCSESNKCYCARKPNTVTSVMGQQHPSIMEQLRQKGIVPAESTLSRAASPDGTRRSRSVKTSSRSLATSKSLEYLQVRSSSVRNSAENLALDYDLFSPGDGRRSSQCSSSSEKVLVVSARDPQGRLIYVGGTDERAAAAAGRDGKSSSRHCRGGAGAHRHHEALSIKKSAEIAAVFGGQARINRRTSSASSLRSSVSLEAGLGYLP